MMMIDDVMSISSLELWNLVDDYKDVQLFPSDSYIILGSFNCIVSKKNVLGLGLLSIFGMLKKLLNFLQQKYFSEFLFIRQKKFAGGGGAQGFVFASTEFSSFVVQFLTITSDHPVLCR